MQNAGAVRIETSCQMSWVFRSDNRTKYKHSSNSGTMHAQHRELLQQRDREQLQGKAMWVDDPWRPRVLKQSHKMSDWELDDEETSSVSLQSFEQIKAGGK